MVDLLRLILPIYFIVYFGVAFVFQSVVVARRTGKNPFVFPKDESAYGLIGFYFKSLMIALFVYVFIYSIFPAWHSYFLPIKQLDNSVLKYIGFFLLFVSFVWTVIAQTNMKNSWRIGIDTVTKTELVTTGLFSISRNPIFFGMIITFTGLFLITPNALTVLFLILGYVLIQIQIRLEEDFLHNEHGEKYVEYKKKVRRMI
jgi:protein-S-isoprenylcysteine O-methyltransferase Ste14